MTSIAHIFKFQTIRQKIMLVVAVSIFLTLSVTIAIFYGVMEVINRQFFNQISTNIYLASENISQKFITINQFSSVIVSDNEIQDLLINRREYNDYSTFTHATEGINTILSIYHDQLQKHFVDYLLIDGQGIRAKTYTVRERFLPEQILSKIIEKSKIQYGSFYVTEYSKEYGLFLIYPIRRYASTSFDYLGTLIININPRNILDALSPNHINLNDLQYVLFDGSLNTIFASSDTIERTIISSKNLYRTPYVIQKIDDINYMIISRIIYSDWMLYTLLPYNTVIKTNQYLRIVSFFVIAFIGIVSIFTTYNILRNSFSKPIRELVIHMQSFGTSAEPLSTIKNHFINRKDEIGYLYKTFEKMTTDIIQLIDVNYKNELLYKESKLNYLQAQINPHFLFNTLDSISWRAKMSRDAITTRIVESLSVLLRASLSDKKHFTLREEIDLAKHYLTIQKIRYGDQLTYSLECPDSLQNACFPHMVLQPVIENAIKYSLEFNGEACHIFLDAFISEDLLSVDIKNSGSQFEEDHLYKLEKSMIETSGFGIGLLNIQQRIQLNYGADYGLYLYNDEEKAVVEIQLPLLLKDEDCVENDDC